MSSKGSRDAALYDDQYKDSSCPSANQLDGKVIRVVEDVYIDPVLPQDIEHHLFVGDRQFPDALEVVIDRYQQLGEPGASIAECAPSVQLS
ncbi:MAG: hypothetical protein ACYC27_21990 [Armatimonadota bacterium]